VYRFETSYLPFLGTGTGSGGRMAFGGYGVKEEVKEEDVEDDSGRTGSSRLGKRDVNGTERRSVIQSDRVQEEVSGSILN